MEELKQKWDLIIQTLKEDYDITDMSFRTWIKPIQVYSVVGDKITLLIPENNNDGDGKGLSYNMRVGYIERKYLAAITLTIAEIMGREYDVTLMSSIDKEKIDKKQKQKILPHPKIIIYRILILIIHLKLLSSVIIIILHMPHL